MTLHGAAWPLHAGDKGLRARPPTTVGRTVVWAVRWGLLAPWVTPAARALPVEQAGRARARLTRIRRGWTGPPLAHAVVRALLPPGSAVVGALDTPRRGPWEGWRAGIVVAGRPLPSAW